jgi:hypothetical protein
MNVYDVFRINYSFLIQAFTKIKDATVKTVTSDCILSKKSLGSFRASHT